MIKQDGFILFENTSELADWLSKVKNRRTISRVQNHHTYRPN